MKNSTDVNFGGVSTKLLVEREQAYEFFHTKAGSIEEDCRCTLGVYDAEGIGLARYFILEVVGEVSDLRNALTRTASFFQSFSIHEMMIPVMKLLMDGSQESRAAETSVKSCFPFGPLYKVVTEYRLPLYYVAVALVGESGTMLSKIQKDYGAIITLEEIMGLPGQMMVYIIENDEETHVVKKRVADLKS